MRIIPLILLLIMSLYTAVARNVNPAPVCELLDRVGGEGTSERIVTMVDEKLSSEGKDVFVIGSRKGLPLVKGSSISALRQVLVGISIIMSM